MADDPLIQKLRAARADYDTELRWVRFLLDAYGGTGGFSGRVEPPAVASLGWVAHAYGLGSSNDTTASSFDFWSFASTYLDQYPREDAQKFRKRVEVSHYDNYVETIFDLLLSYALKSPSTVEDLPDAVDVWKESATFNGTSWWDYFRHVIARRAGLMGWTPCIVDQEPRPAGEQLSEAQVEAAGIRVAPFVTALTPANVLDWYIDEKAELQWVKIRLHYKRQPNPMADPVEVEQYKIYTKETVQTWEVVEEKVVSAEPAAPHPFGRVPLVSFQQKPNVEEPIRGVSMIGDASVASRRLFNLHSELDEHIRSNVFALLQVPVPEGQDPPDEVIGGTGNAVPVPASSQRSYEFVAPPDSVAKTLETRIANTVREVFRRARVQFGGEGASRQQSGISKQWDFEETNRLLADFVAQLARAERDVYRIVGRALGVSPDALDAIRVTPPTNFAVEDLAAEIENATNALLLELGPTMDFLIKRRISPRLVPNMSTEDGEAVEAELETERNNRLSEAALEGDIESASSGDDEDDNNEPPPSPGAGNDDGEDES